ncbi:cbb3-type cytochrome c oxidase N-terminal domain-containing protein [Spirosoma arcticum]
MNLLISLSGDPAKSIWNVASGQELVWLMLSLMLLIGLIGVGIIALNLLFILRKALRPEPLLVPVPQLIDPRSLWQRVAGLHLLSQEKDLMMEHAYDGIAELDNPTPPWFMGLFYGSIVAAVTYMIVFHVVGSGDIMGSEYVREMAIADKQREAYIAKVAGGINENTVIQLVDLKGIGAGKTLYAQNCVACHGANAEGKVGPNLTDAFWLHGGSVNRIFHTLTEGVPAKGMIAWKRQLNPLQIQQLASYVMSLQGSNPAGAKEPQGEKETAKLSAFGAPEANIPAADAPVAMR